MVKYLTNFLIFILLSSLSLSYPEKSLTYKELLSTKIFKEKISNGITYIISYETGDINNNYIKISINTTNEDDDLYAYYSPISSKRGDAYLLNKGKHKLYLYINKAFTKLEAGGIIYLTIASFDSECNFSLQADETEYIEIESNSQYSFFTTNKKNLENNFIFWRKEKEKGNVTLWASGSKDINMNVRYLNYTYSEDNFKIYEFDNGKYTIIKDNDNNFDVFYIIEITAPMNTLITIGSNINLYNANNRDLNPTKYIINTNEIYGALTKHSPMQCFHFNIGEKNNTHLSILDFNNNLELKIYDKDQKENSALKINNRNMLYIINQENADKYFCLNRIDDNDENNIFMLQVTNDVENNNFKNMYSPQINGYFYERKLEKGEYAFFTGLPLLNFKTELRYYLKKISGYPEMYFLKCKEHPKCKFNMSSLPSDAIKPKVINDMFSYSIFKTETTKLISPEQYVLLVYCNGEQQCSFETNFYSEYDNIILQKDKRTYHTIMYKGKNNFLINLEGEKNFKQVIVNFLTYTGDISINAEGDGYNIGEFLAGNKKYYILDFNKTGNIINNKIYFYIEGKLASFYSVDYKLIYSDEDKIKMQEESGITYLETIEPKIGNITISIKNRRLFEKRNFAVNFFPLNCKIDITRKISNENKNITSVDFLAQDVIKTSDNIYNNEYYDYLMEIISMDNVTAYDNNLCMVYVSSLEQNLDTENDYQKRYLLVSEGVINRVILNQDLPKIEYIYPNLNPTGYVIIYINFNTKSKINIIIYISNKKYKEIITLESQYIIIPDHELRSNSYCPYIATNPNQVCSIITEIKLDKNFYNDEPILEYSIKSHDIVPVFIRKSMARKDIIVGNHFQYFYTEIGPNEEGHINIKFDRGSGNVYGRIVEKNINEASGWMNHIILPDENSNRLDYNYFSKKIYYDQFQTKKCKMGCYLIIKVVPNFSDNYYKSEEIAYPITLSVYSSKDSASITQDNLNVVDIPLNEYIVGDTAPTHDIFLYFYSLFIPYDCEKLEIEFLCESSYIYINVGNKKPLVKENPDFSYKVMDQDGILTITKQQILEKMGVEGERSIKNVELTIAVGALYLDDEVSSVYSFRIRAVRKNEIELINLNSDQETLCKTEGKNGNCYFIIKSNDKINSQNNFFFHAVYLPNIEFNYYAKEINKTTIMNRNQEVIKNYLPNKENNDWSNDNSGENYLYIDNSEIKDKENSYIILNLEIKSPYKKDNESTIITLLHTLYSYKGDILPNPASAQLFIVNINNANQLNFKFDEKSNNLLIRIKSVSGKGAVYWDMSYDDEVLLTNYISENINSENENVYYYFNTPGETITLTLGIEDRVPLKFKNMAPNEMPGFGFYVYYEREAQTVNNNYLVYGENSVYNFKDTDFPFIFYTKLNDLNHLIDMDIKLLSLKSKYSSFDDNNNINNNKLSSEEALVETPLYNNYIIKGIVMSESDIYNINTFSNLDENKMFEGKYNPFSNAFKIQFTPQIIKNAAIEGNNYALIKVEKGIDNNDVYNDITMEINVLPLNEQGYKVEENKYIYGKIPEGEGENNFIMYELSRRSKDYKFMKIEFSANYDKIHYTLNSFKFGDNISIIDFNKNNIENTTEEYNGKKISILEFKDTQIKSIFLSVFINQNNESYLSNYIFKYELNKENNFLKIKPNKDHLTSKYDISNSILHITLPSYNNLNSDSKVNYIIKLIPLKDILKHENYNTISLIETKAIKIYKKTQKNPTKEEIVDLIDLNNDMIYYVIINSEVIYNNTEEKFGFKWIENPTDYREEEEDKEEGLSTWTIVLIVLLSLFVLFLIILVVVCYRLRKGNLEKSMKLDELKSQIKEGPLLEMK